MKHVSCWFGWVRFTAAVCLLSGWKSVIAERRLESPCRWVHCCQSWPVQLLTARSPQPCHAALFDTSPLLTPAPLVPVPAPLKWVIDPVSLLSTRADCSEHNQRSAAECLFNSVLLAVKSELLLVELRVGKTVDSKHRQQDKILTARGLLWCCVGSVALVTTAENYPFRKYHYMICPWELLHQLPNFSGPWL